MPETESHPLNGTFAYFDSQLQITVGPSLKYVLDGREYVEPRSFTGEYSVELSPGQRYGWPVIGGVVNPLPLNPAGGTDELTNTGYEFAFVIFSPNVHRGDPTYGSIDLSRFIDSWAGYAGVDPKTKRVEQIQMRFLNVTFTPAEGSNSQAIRTAWSAFSWQPKWEDYGARSYIRIPT
jgi:hypothetical protein